MAVGRPPFPGLLADWRSGYCAGARLAVPLTVGLWCAVALIFTATTLHNGERLGLWMSVHAALALAGMVISTPIYFAALATASARRALRFGGLAAMVLAAAFIHSLVDYLILRFGFWMQPELRAPTLVKALLFNMMLYVWIYAFYAAAVVLIFTDLKARHNERQLLEARAAADRARLDALRLQINPHFLFNTLNAATSLVGLGRNADAEAVLLRLSDLFRGSLSAPVGEVNTLQAEFDLIGAYLEIESVRFGHRLEIECSIPADLRLAATPHFLLQPLIENAVQYGAARVHGRTVIQVLATSVEGGLLRLTVANDEFTDSDRSGGGGGGGLQQVRERLTLLYGDQARLRTRRRDGRFIAEIEMPLTLRPGPASEA